MATYLTNDQWAVKKGYDADGETAAFDVFLAEEEYPTAAALTAMREEACGNINEQMGRTSNVSTHVNYLRGLEYRMVELMIDEEQGRSNEEARSQFIPRDYIFDRDRKKLNGIAGFNRGVHG